MRLKISPGPEDPNDVTHPWRRGRSDEASIPLAVAIHVDARLRS
jgi:hypothetical protein